MTKRKRVISQRNDSWAGDTELVHTNLHYKKSSPRKAYFIFKPFPFLASGNPKPWALDWTCEDYGQTFSGFPSEGTGQDNDGEISDFLGHFYWITDSVCGWTTSSTKQGGHLQLVSYRCNCFYVTCLDQIFEEWLRCVKMCLFLLFQHLYNTSGRETSIFFFIEQLFCEFNGLYMKVYEKV